MTRIFKLLLRQFKKQPILSLGKEFSLILGLFSGLLLIMFANQEFGFDKYADNYDRIYRVTSSKSSEGIESKFAGSPIPLLPTLFESFNEIENYARIVRSGYPKATVLLPDESFNIRNTFITDSRLISLLSINVVSGSAAILDKPNTAMISESIASHLFGNEDPIGKQIRVITSKEWASNDPGNTKGFEYIVSGIFSQPQNSHLRFNILLSWSTFKLEDNWLHPSFNYVMLKDPGSLESLLKKSRRHILKNYSDVLFTNESEFNFYFQPLGEIHFSDGLNYDVAIKGNKQFVVILLIIGLFCLMIGIINYSSIAISLFANRVREFRTKLSLGLTSQRLKYSLFIEISISIIASFSVAILLLVMVNPIQFESPIEYVLPVLICLVIYTIIVTALVFNPLMDINFISSKSTFNLGSLRSQIIKSQMGVQLLITFVTLITFYTINKQYSFIKGRDIGFDYNDIIVLKLPINQDRDMTLLFKNELDQHSLVKKSSLTENLPGEGEWKNKFRIEKEGQSTDLMVSYMKVDEDFFQLLDIPLLEGRGFDINNKSDFFSAFILNETAVKEFGLENPLRTKIGFINWLNELSPWNGQTVGVVNDFHFQSLKNKVGPLIIQLSNYSTRIYIKYDSQNIPAGLKITRSIFDKYYPEAAFDYDFLEDTYYNIHLEESRLNEISLYLSAILMTMCCLGIIGISKIQNIEKEKALSIRKIFGASVGQLTILNLKSLSKLTLPTIIISVVISYLTINYWLSNYAYKISVGVLEYLLPILGGLLVLIFSIILSQYKMVRSSPINYIRKTTI